MPCLALRCAPSPRVLRCAPSPPPRQRRYARSLAPLCCRALLVPLALLAPLPTPRRAVCLCRLARADADRFGEGCEGVQELLHDVYTIRPSCTRYFELLDRQSRMPHGVGATPASCAGAIELVGVTLTFPGRSEPALRNVSLSISAGETLALCGPSGAGKSTLVRLLNRLYDPDEGFVTLDGADLTSLDLEWLRSRVGYVPQAPELFDVSVAENVRFGPPAHPPTDTQVRDALSASGSTEFVERLSQGSASRVGEGGRQLSGGQRQRLAVARALARQPPLLIWDEATSALDATTEKQVHAALRSTARGSNRTAVIVAHRLSSVLCADRVAVLCNGTIEEVGTPSELARSGGWFQRNFETQHRAALRDENAERTLDIPRDGIDSTT